MVKKIGQNLGGMIFIGQPVPDRHTGIGRQLFDDFLPESPVFDAVIHSAQNTGGVLHGFLMADLRTGGAEIGHMGTLVVGGHLKGAARAGGGFLEDQGDVFSRQPGLLDPAYLAFFRSLDRSRRKAISSGE